MDSLKLSKVTMDHLFLAQFYHFMKELGAKHTTSSPYWPQGNAEVERFMQPLAKAIKTAHLEGN